MLNGTYSVETFKKSINFDDRSVDFSKIIMEFKKNIKAGINILYVWLCSAGECCMWAVLNVVTEAAVRTPALCLLSGLLLGAAVTRFHPLCLCEFIHSCPCTVNPLPLSLFLHSSCAVSRVP